MTHNHNTTSQTTIEWYPMMHLVSCYIITAYVTYHDQIMNIAVLDVVSKNVSVQQPLLLRISS